MNITIFLFFIITSCLLLILLWAYSINAGSKKINNWQNKSIVEFIKHGNQILTNVYPSFEGFDERQFNSRGFIEKLDISSQRAFYNFFENYKKNKENSWQKRIVSINQNRYICTLFNVKRINKNKEYGVIFEFVPIGKKKKINKSFLKTLSLDLFLQKINKKPKINQHLFIVHFENKENYILNFSKYKYNAIMKKIIKILQKNLKDSMFSFENNTLIVSGTLNNTIKKCKKRIEKALNNKIIKKDFLFQNYKINLIGFRINNKINAPLLKKITDQIQPILEPTNLVYFFNDIRKSPQLKKYLQELKDFKLGFKNPYIKFEAKKIFNLLTLKVWGENIKIYSEKLHYFLNDNHSEKFLTAISSNMNLKWLEKYKSWKDRNKTGIKIFPFSVQINSHKFTTNIKKGFEIVEGTNTHLDFINLVSLKEENLINKSVEIRKKTSSPYGFSNISSLDSFEKIINFQPKHICLGKEFIENQESKKIELLYIIKTCKEHNINLIMTGIENISQVGFAYQVGISLIEGPYIKKALDKKEEFINEFNKVKY